MVLHYVSHSGTSSTYFSLKGTRGGLLVFTTIVNIILVLRIHAIFERSLKGEYSGYACAWACKAEEVELQC